MFSERIFVSMIVTLSLVQFITCNVIKLDEISTHSPQLQSEEKSDVDISSKDSSELQTTTQEKSSGNIEVPKGHGYLTGQNAEHLEVPEVHGYLTEQNVVTLMETPNTEEDASSTTSEDTEETLIAQPADSYDELRPATL